MTQTTRNTMYGSPTVDANLKINFAQNSSQNMRPFIPATFCLILLFDSNNKQDYRRNTWATINLNPTLRLLPRSKDTPVGKTVNLRFVINWINQNRFVIVLMCVFLTICQPDIKTDNVICVHPILFGVRLIKFPLLAGNFVERAKLVWWWTM